MTEQSDQVGGIEPVEDEVDPTKRDRSETPEKVSDEIVEQARRELGAAYAVYAGRITFHDDPAGNDERSASPPTVKDLEQKIADWLADAYDVHEVVVELSRTDREGGR